MGIVESAFLAAGATIRRVGRHGWQGPNATARPPAVLFRGQGKRFLLKSRTLSLARDKMLSEAARRTKIVFDAVMALHDAGDNPFRPGDVVARLRDDGRPYGAWEVRGELTNLERLGLIELDEELAVWRLVDGATFSIEAAKTLSRM